VLFQLDREVNQMLLFSKKASPATEKMKQINERRTMICDHLSFCASEAYKLLRTNITFSFPQNEEADCKAIGVTSSIRAEGKSVTAINLAYSLALDGKNVLLMECDLRLPTLSKRMSLNRAPGLSNVLVGLNSIDDAVQQYKDQTNLHVLTAGEVPPNPSELLGSGRMKKLLAELRKSFDYVILDLPPVTIVADALVISKIADGMLIVVRQDYTDRNILSDTIKQLQFVNANILGFVFNCVEDKNPKNKYKRYYKRYGYKYDYKYGDERGRK
jgi:capsular exopolysaccharide synthesis family protein